MATRECYIAMLEMEDHQQTMCIEEQRTMAEPVEELEQVTLDESRHDMLGINPLVIVHRLNVNPTSSPIRQKKREFAPERDKAIAKEVRKLLEAGFNREVYYLDWLANVVMIKKANGKWRICSTSQTSTEHARKTAIPSLG